MLSDRNIILGGTFPVMTSALTRLDPYTFTTLRYGFAGIALLIALYFREGRQGLSLKGERTGLAWMLGSAAFVGFGFFVFAGQKMAGSNGTLTASIMMATMPMPGILVNGLTAKNCTTTSFNRANYAVLLWCHNRHYQRPLP